MPPVQLTDRGHEQAERLADRYAVDRLLSSDLRRARNRPADQPGRRL